MLRFLFNTILIGFLVVVAAAGVLIWQLIPELPAIETLKDHRLQVPLRVYTKNASLIAEFGEKRRRPTKLAEVPDKMIKAFLAAEDDRFFDHPGVDWQAILRATLHLLKTGEKAQGGSTITMQVARNFFLSREKTYLRKLNEILLALKIERELSKEAIFELYVNKIYFGHRSYGVSAAAQVYYGIDLNELSLAQIAMIASLPKAPSTLNPIANPSRALERRNYVLRRMHTLGYIDDGEYEYAVATPITASFHGPTIDVSARHVAEMVRRYIKKRYGDDAYTKGFRVITTIDDRLQSAANEALRNALLDYDRRHGYRGVEHRFPLTGAENEQDLERLLRDFPLVGGLRPALVTKVEANSASLFVKGQGPAELRWEAMKWARPYIDADRRGPAPKNAADIVTAGNVVRIKKSPETGLLLAQIPEVAGGFVSLSPDDGAVLALTGGFDFQQSKFNRVTQGRRQPGSNFKPFIYSAALDAGYTAASIIHDEPIIYEKADNGKPWAPENYSGKFYGPTRLREGLTFSRNIVSVQLLDGVGIDRAIDHVTRFGFDRDRLPRVLSIALGSAAFTPIEIAKGYAVLANGGYQVAPYFIGRIETWDGEVLMQSDPPTVCRTCSSQNGLVRTRHPGSTPDGAVAETAQKPAAERVINPQNMWLMYSMMRDVIQRGTARRARVLGRKDLAGKTGTTNDLKDAWFSGFNRNIVATTWVGFDDNRTLGRHETGAKAALPIWIDFMKVALEGIPDTTPPQPPGLVTVRIDPYTGLLATFDDDQEAIFETFQEKYAPQRYSSDVPFMTDLDASDGTSAVDQLF